MALSAHDRKEFWQEQRDSLNRIRSRLSDRDSPRHSPEISPRRRNHSPYGKYRKPSSPAYLPRLDSPEDNRRSKLRGHRYDVVPPVDRRGTRRSPPVDYDSWGEESDEDEYEEDYNHRPNYMPQLFQYPGAGYQGFPMYQAPVVYGPPFPVFYPPPPKNKGKKRSRRNKSPDFMKVHQSQPLFERSRRGKPDIRYSYPGRRRSPPDKYRREDVKSEVLERYKYTYPRDSPFSVAAATNVAEEHFRERYNGDIDSLVYYYFQDHPLFAEETTDWILSDLLDEIIPDFLIESFSGFSKLTPSHPYFLPSKESAEEILDDAVQKMIVDTVREAVNDMVNEYMGHRGGDDWLTALVNERISNSIFSDVLDDVIDENKDELLSDIVLELTLEDIISEDVIEPEVEAEAEDIAFKTLNHFDNKLMRKELKAVSKVAFDRMMEGFILDNVLLLISKQGKVWGENDHFNKIMDDFLVNILIEQYYGVRESRHKTVECKPLRRMHEKATTDVALDFLLQQLSASLDEDLADVDEYERGVQDADDNAGTPVPKTSKFFLS